MAASTLWSHHHDPVPDGPGAADRGGHAVIVTTANGKRVMSDEALMQLVQKTDFEAFETLFERHWAGAFRIAGSICCDRGTAEDAAQEAFLELWRDRRAYRPEAGSFRRWAMTFVRRRAIDAVRHEASRPRRATSREVQADQQTEAGSPTPEGTIISREESEYLRGSLGRLPSDQAEVIDLAFFGQLSHTEIAERLSLPPGTVKGRMRLGLEKLRVQLEPQ